MASSYASAAKRPTSTPFSFKRTVRLNVPKDNTDITTKSLLEALTEQGHHVVGAQGCYGGRAFDVMLKTPADAEQLGMRGFDLFECHHEVVSLAKNYIYVSVYIPMEFPDTELQAILVRYGTVKAIRRLHMKEDGLRQLENGVRVVSFEAIQTAIPRRLSISGISIVFKYTGQPESCLRCSSMEHKVKDCPHQKRRKRKEQHEKEGFRVDLSSEGSPQPNQNKSQGHQEACDKSQESFNKSRVRAGIP
jgi:hypothetical protein